MNKAWLVHISVVIMIFLIGYYLFNTMAYTLETTPDIREIGPPVYDLWLIAMLILIAVVICGICMLVPIKEEGYSEDLRYWFERNMELK